MANQFYSLSKQKGFTLVELMVIFGVSMILFGLVAFNMIRFQNTSSQQTSIDTLISDLKSQQFMAMTGATEGRSTSDNYGIYFMQDEYVLFHGGTYNPADPTNFTIELPSDIEIQSTTLPSNNVIFTKISGEISGFTAGNNTITVREKNINKQVVITLNKYGVITSVN
jgi:type II secretory pathway pseudopilin PulG